MSPHRLDARTPRLHAAMRPITGTQASYLRLPHKGGTPALCGNWCGWYNEHR